MSYKFSDSTNRVRSGFTRYNLQRSYSFWVYKTGDNGSGFGYIFGRELTNGNTERFNSNGSTALHFVMEWTGARGEWFINGALTNNTWLHFVLTYDANSSGNKPICYKNGKAIRVDTVAAPSGSPVMVANSEYVIGNNAVNTLRGWVRILSPAEANELGAKRKSPEFIKEKLAYYLPMRDDLCAKVGNAAAYNTGALVTRAAHPKVIYPSELITPDVYVPSVETPHPYLVMRRFV